LAALIAAAITATLLHLAEVIDTTGNARFAGESGGVSVFNGLIASVADRALSAATITAIVTALLGQRFVGKAVGLAGDALEELKVAGFRFKAIATGGATVAGNTALLASTGTFVLDADVAFAAVVTFGADATDVLTGALIPATLLVRNEERRHETLGGTRGHAHAALAVPITGALTAASTTGVVATFFAEAIWGAVNLFDTEEAQQLRTGWLIGGASSAGITAIVRAALFGSAIGEAGRYADCPTTLRGFTREARRASATDIATAVVTTLLADATGFAVFLALAGIEVALGFRVAEAALAATAVITTLDAVALWIARTGYTDTFNARHILIAVATASNAAVGTAGLAFAVRFAGFRNALEELVTEEVVRTGATGFQIA
jgi:hypothetical protein